MARKGRTTESVNNGIEMIRWAIELVLERGDSSWSLENVATKETKAILTELQAACPERVAYHSRSSIRPISVRHRTVFG